MKLKPLPKLILLVLGVGAVLMGVRHAVYTGLIPRPNMLKSVIPVKAEEISAEVLSNPANVKPVDLGTNKPAVPCVDGNTSNCLNGPVHEAEVWAWNANGSFLTAVGAAKSPDGKGIMTSKGSLMEKKGVNVKVIRQDDSGQMKTDLLATAQALKTDPNAPGIKFVTIMGDGGGQFFKDLEKACPTCEFEVAGVLGYSRGEDGFWGPPEAKTNCEALRGGVGYAVVRDGDWNIGIKKLAQCNIPNNPDDTVYDPQAFNWINAPDYLKAVEMLITSPTVELPVKGKLGGGKIKVPVKYVATWTPGDVNLAKQKGGLVPILTTKNSVFQMPCILVGIKSWNAAHADDVKKILSASFEAADQMKTNPDAIRRFGEVSAALYKEKDAAYWIKYYRGVTEPDLTGNMVPLGGSAVSNLADNLQAFGLAGGPNLFAATYNTFGKYVVAQYPKMYPDFPAVEKILNTRYVLAVKAEATLPMNNAEDLVRETTASMKSVAGKKDYSIQFASGSANILPSSFAVLNGLADELMITNYIVALHGYTDAAKWTSLSPEASAEKNMELSNLRATAVQAYLHSRGVKNTLRVYPHGQEDPVADNSTDAGRAANRRVQVVVGE